ncbi:CHRD domain-containing protein [Brevibacillus reuszeri]|uniref:CHRD domain-containing protein n=1 Tax=Brevibacillus reuszeri TaxID=54915 RepID=UPI002100BCB3|nr:CHRD domain-containing protein [Brevibacillus reuszeri]MED1856433.1 CHRD domain-containing protein [Brevibacillus reuszeri]
MRGSEEAPPVTTNATGNIHFRLSEDGQLLEYRLVVNQLRKLTQAHILMGAKGANGLVVVTLFGPISRGISVNRGVVTGAITQNDLVGPLQGRTFAELLRLMNDGMTYVDAHTTQHPNGEIRGQIRCTDSRRQ